VVDNFVMYPKCKHYNILLCNIYIWSPPYIIFGELKVIEMEDSKVFAIPISLVKKMSFAVASNTCN
jgi:hypothetical protein